MNCHRYRVCGRVQGVAFRFATQRRARELAVDGWVRNCEDGSVEILACGTAAALASLEAWLWRGPSLAQVHEVRVEVQSENTGEPGFTIRG